MQSIYYAKKHVYLKLIWCFCGLHYKIMGISAKIYILITN